MLRSCVVCGESFESCYRKWFDKYVPDVCSSKCFLKELYTGDHIHFPVVTEEEPLEGVQLFKDKADEYRSTYEEMFSGWLWDHGIVFLYEPYIFELSGKDFYVPDFYLVQYGVFVEVKGLWEVDGRRKYKKFTKELPYINILADLQFIKLLRRTPFYASRKIR